MLLKQIMNFTQIQAFDTFVSLQIEKYKTLVGVRFEFQTFLGHGSHMSYFLSDNPGPNLADALVEHSSLPKPNVAALAFFTRLQLLISRTDMREGEDSRLCDLCLGGDRRRKSRNRC